MKKVFSKMDKPLLFISIAFFIFGLVMVLSASSMESYMRYGYNPYHYFIRQALFMGLGTIIFLIVIRVPTKFYRAISYVLILGIAVVLGLLLAYGYVSNEAQSWFKIGSFSIQPSEFAKVIIILFLASYYDRQKESLENTKKLVFPLIPVVIVFGLVAVQPDLGTALIIALVTALIFFSLPMPRKVRRKFLGIIVACVALVVGIFILTDGSILEDYQKARFNFLDPCERYQEESGYQLCNSFIAFKNGGLTGQGIGKSTQKYLYLPESYTDFIFPIIVEEWGAWMGILIVLMYMFVIYRLYRIARRASNLQGSIIAYGVCAYMFCHVTVNLVGVMGMAPLTGVPLPFLSYGGSYVISSMIALGLAERVAIESTTVSMNNKSSKKKK